MKRTLTITVTLSGVLLLSGCQVTTVRHVPSQVVTERQVVYQPSRSTVRPVIVQQQVQQTTIQQQQTSQTHPTPRARESRPVRTQNPTGPRAPERRTRPSPQPGEGREQARQTPPTRPSPTPRAEQSGRRQEPTRATPAIPGRGQQRTVRATPPERRAAQGNTRSPQSESHQANNASPPTPRTERTARQGPSRSTNAPDGQDSSRATRITPERGAAQGRGRER